MDVVFIIEDELSRCWIEMDQRTSWKVVHCLVDLKTHFEKYLKYYMNKVIEILSWGGVFEPFSVRFVSQTLSGGVRWLKSKFIHVRSKKKSFFKISIFLVGARSPRSWKSVIFRPKKNMKISHVFVSSRLESWKYCSISIGLDAPDPQLSFAPPLAIRECMSDERPV